MGLATHPALAATLCVGGSGCYTSIQQALDHTQNGDTIRIDPGTFAGGVTISASASLMGAGAGKTIIQGGRATPTAPVIRIGIYLAASEPSVSISGVTITGGNNTSDTDPFDDSGGGIKVEPPVGATAGTIGPAGTITIMNSVITGNSVLSLGGESWLARSPSFASIRFPCRDAEKARSRTITTGGERGRLSGRWMLSGCTVCGGAASGACRHALNCGSVRRATVLHLASREAERLAATDTPLLDS